MDKKQTAINAHIDGYNCSQSVVGAFCEELNLDKEVAMRMASGFGGGMRCKSTCGAVTGALMALGLKYGQTEASDQITKMNMYEIVTAFQDKFKEKNKSLLCPDLLGQDILTEEGKAQIQEQGLSRSICDQMIADAVEIVEEILEGKSQDIKQ